LPFSRREGSTKKMASTWYRSYDNAVAKARMLEMLKQFSFKDTHAFNDLLRVTSSVVAGSSSLYAVRPWVQNDDTCSKFDGDLDIWVRIPKNLENLDKSSLRLENLLSYVWDSFIAKHNYKMIVNGNMDASEYRNMYKQAGGNLEYIIHRVDTWENYITKKRVQVIYYNDRNQRPSVEFDYSFCAVEWTGSAILMKEQELTLEGKGYSMNTTRIKEERLKKYNSRGFVLVDKPNTSEISKKVAEEIQSMANRFSGRVGSAE
jgi:hypothetical protein